MSNASMTATINAPADAVWRNISDFNGAGKYIDLITNSTMEGSGVGAVRTLTLQDGGRIVERLESLDESARVLRYSIVDSPLPIDEYVSTIEVRDLGGNRCELAWSSVFQPKGASEAEGRQIIEGIYSVGIDGLKKLHGG